MTLRPYNDTATSRYSPLLYIGLCPSLSYTSSCTRCPRRTTDAHGQPTAWQCWIPLHRGQYVPRGGVSLPTGACAFAPARVQTLRHLPRAAMLLQRASVDATIQEQACSLLGVVRSRRNRMSNGIPKENTANGHRLLRKDEPRTRAGHGVAPRSTSQETTPLRLRPEITCNEIHFPTDTHCCERERFTLWRRVRKATAWRQCCVLNRL